MKYYAGLDVSNKTTSICIMNETGRVIAEATVTSCPETIYKFIKSTKLELEALGLESGFISHWLVTGLKKHKLPVISMDARKVAGILEARINKTDRNDAQGICDILRSGFYSEVHHKTQEAMELGTQLQAREALVRMKISLTNSIRGLLRTYGVRIDTSKRKPFTEKAREALKAVSPNLQYSVTALITSLETICEQLAGLDHNLEALAERDADVELLTSIPGVGLITALAFKAEIDNAPRFARSRNVGAYFGLTPSQYSSGETCRQGRISKQGSSMVRSLLVGAGISMLTHVKTWSKVKAWGCKIQKKHGTKKAGVAMARKLSVVMHRMLITKERFQPGEQKKGTASLRKEKPIKTKVA